MPAAAKTSWNPRRKYRKADASETWDALASPRRSDTIELTGSP